ncbi:Uncharacterized protein TCAP_06526 [Tolypocladium capitatum]|uniref:2EXR domain-containing protein n=1 Tax=Tolypocladium capitatum TaxID=45235 RepID=A0A2K3Q7P2_9HYPO|nr:Uncharacterized protein TCAP_06526 [Tolypocladium capitatum]
MTANSSAFPLFSSLPPELRIRIWRDALPDRDGPALYPYRKGCWCPRRISESDDGPEHADDTYLFLEFRHDLLDSVHVKAPLAFVNREARCIALAWARKRGIEMRVREDSQCPVLARPFDPVHDALYVALDKFNDFCCEPYDRLFQPDLVDQGVSSSPDVTRIAIPEALLRSEDTTLHQVTEWFPRLAVIFIVVDAQPDLEDDGTKVQRRWELEGTEGRAFVRNHDHGGFDLGDGEYVGDEALYRRIEEASKGLSEVFGDDLVRRFEIRPVFAVRR